MASLWEEVHSMLKKNLQKVSEDPTKRVAKEKPQERHRTESGVHNMQQDSNASDQEYDMVRTKIFNFHGVRLVVIKKQLR